mmetsp:Transcript_39925/g.103036  ORF Transcript_39925/g.103036 Transcript_39925/m.103036 type:complete len:101 (-) Transcript_39925:6418-6720(-)
MMFPSLTKRNHGGTGESGGTRKRKDQAAIPPEERSVFIDREEEGGATSKFISSKQLYNQLPNGCLGKGWDERLFLILFILKQKRCVSGKLSPKRLNMGGW